MDFLILFNITFGKFWLLDCIDLSTDCKLPTARQCPQSKTSWDMARKRSQRVMDNCEQTLSRLKEELWTHSFTHSLTFATGCCPAVGPLLKHPNTSSRNKQALLSSTEQRLDWREQAGWGSTAGCQPLRSSCCPSHSHTKRNIEKKSPPPAICFSLFFFHFFLSEKKDETRD